MTGCRTTAIVAGLACAGVAASGVATAAPESRSADEPEANASARVRVKVGDNFFSPRRLAVRRRTRVVWRWARRNRNTHNVLLVRGPRGVRRFQSPSARSRFRYAKRLRRPGLYRFVCTFHANMRMRIRVRR